MLSRWVFCYNFCHNNEISLPKISIITFLRKIIPPPIAKILIYTNTKFYWACKITR